MPGFEETGAAHWRGLLSPDDLAELEERLHALCAGGAGNRLALPNVSTLGAVQKVVAKAAAIIGPAARIVRALLLDKTAETNWTLNWHQDRVIEVAKRVDLPGFRAWTMKDGRQHVSPPITILEKMVTARLHLDDVGVENAPLLISPGSHRLGAISETDVPTVVERLGQSACHAARGDVWIYSTPILHASRAATKPCRRRVLQIDISRESLHGGLEWASLDGVATSERFA
ncbi:MAG: phytanoyl-CoA dioxygenase family protein [Sphingomonas sp.]|nr:phytanoyl-CoA dioxygenase family protein [Sphingomonas sp.]